MLSRHDVERSAVINPPKNCLVLPSIHPFIHFHPLIRCRVVEVQKRNSEILLPSNTLQLLLGDPEAFPGQKGLQRVLGLPRGLRPVGRTWKTSKGKFLPERKKTNKNTNIHSWP